MQSSRSNRDERRRIVVLVSEPSVDPPGLDPGKPTDKKAGPRPRFRFLLTVTKIHR